MNQTGIKILLAFALSAAVNAGLAVKISAGTGVSPLEAALAVSLLQIAVTVILCISPPAEKRQKRICWLFAEVLVFCTAFLWGAACAVSEIAKSVKH